MSESRFEKERRAPPKFWLDTRISLPLVVEAVTIIVILAGGFFMMRSDIQILGNKVVQNGEQIKEVKESVKTLDARLFDMAKENKTAMK